MMSINRLFLCLLMVLAAGPAGLSNLLAEDWPQMRGPSRNGTAGAANIFDDLQTSGLTIEWRRQLGIGGYASVVVADNFAFTTFSGRDGSDYLIALNAGTGEERWRLRIDMTLPGRGGADAGPLSTPALSAGLVFTLSPRGTFHAVSVRSGKPVWQIHLVRDLGGVMPEFGFTFSPLVDRQSVYLQVGASRENTLVALDRSTGKARWSIFMDRLEYSSPALIDIGGQKQIVCRTNNHTFAVEPQTGELLWDHVAYLGQQTHPTPFLIDHERLLVAGFDRSELLRVRRLGTKYRAESLWQSRSLRGNFSEPVYYNGHIYGFSGTLLTCIDPETGKSLWKSRHAGDASLILVDGHLVVLNSTGKLFIAPAKPEGFTEQASLQVTNGRSITPPSFADGRLFIRNLREIVSVGFGQK